MDEKPVVYYTRSCPNCHALMERLTSFGIEFETRDLCDPDTLTDLRCNGCFAMQAPILQIGDMYFWVV